MVETSLNALYDSQKNCCNALITSFSGDTQATTVCVIWHHVLANTIIDLNMLTYIKGEISY